MKIVFRRGYEDDQGSDWLIVGISGRSVSIGHMWTKSGEMQTYLVITLHFLDFGLELWFLTRTE